MTRRSWAVPRAGLVLSAMVALAVAGCGGSGGDGDGDDNASDGDAPDSVTLRFDQDWDSMDFHVDLREGNLSAAGPAYDRLVARDREGKEYVPYLAESWEETPTSLVFQVRTDAKCEDGHVLTAEDMAASFTRFLEVEKRSGSVAASTIGGLGPGPWKIEATGETEVTLTTEAPYGNKLAVFAEVGVVCPAGMEAVKADEHALEDATYGSGPYTLVSATHGDRIVYKLRPEWNWGPPDTTTDTMPREIVLRVVEDSTTAANMLLSGELDISQVDGADIDRLSANDAVTSYGITNYLPHTFVWNMRPGRPLALDQPNSAALREALATVVDPEQWNVAANDGRGTVVSGPFRPEAPCYNAEVENLAPTPSVDAAKEALTSGGFTYDGEKLMSDGEQVRLTLLTTPLLNAGPEYLADLVRSLGIDVKLENLAGASFGEKVVNGDFDTAVLRGDRLPPIPGIGLNPMSGPATPDGYNVGGTGIGDPDFERLVKAGEQSLGDEQCAAYAELQELMVSKHYVRSLAVVDPQIFVSSELSTPKVLPVRPYPVWWITGA